MLENEKLVELPVSDHIKELRERVIKCVIFFLLACCCTMFYSGTIYDFLVNPLIKAMQSNDSVIPSGERRMIFTGLTEGFMTNMYLGVLSGFITSLPYIIGQVYLFISPGLYKREKKIVLLFFSFSFILFIGSVFLGYHFIMPIACKFFLSFESSIKIGNNINIPIVLEARISEYLSTVTTMLVGFSIASQIPLLLVALCSFGMIRANSLKKYRRHAIIINFILAAILTPPDVISQILLAIPMIIMYEITIIVCNKITK